MAVRVVVDDEREYPGDALHLRSSVEALAWLDAGGRCDELWLDHDLGGPDTSRPVALRLVEMALAGTPPAGRVFVHSMNPVGVRWLVTTLDRYYRVSVRRWF